MTVIVIIVENGTEYIYTMTEFYCEKKISTVNKCDS